MSLMTEMTWDRIRQGRVRIPDHVVFRDLAHETVLLNMQTGTYHVVDEIGARFLERMRATSSLDQACADLAAEYEQPGERIAADLAAFCGELNELGLVVLDG